MYFLSTQNIFHNHARQHPVYRDADLMCSAKLCNPAIDLLIGIAGGKMP